MTQNGWIKLHRTLADWQWASDPNTFCLFVHLLLMAQHSPSKWRGETIMPGQLLTGRKKLAEATGLSEQNIRTSLNRLKSTSELTIKKTNKYSIISITNWDKYQTANQQANQQLTSNQPATNHIQECKKEKNENIEPAVRAFEVVAKKRGLPIPRSISNTRERHLIARLEEHGIDVWNEVVGKVGQSDFLCGKAKQVNGHKNWKASFDWLINPTNFNKVLEGNFDSQAANRRNRS